MLSRPKHIAEPWTHGCTPPAPDWTGEYKQKRRVAYDLVLPCCNHSWFFSSSGLRRDLAMSRARISIATILSSSCSVSQGYVSSRRRSNRFRFFSCKGTLLSRVLVCYYSEAAEVSVYDSAGVKHV